ncbi:hypothetical protein M514_08343 [Trichuris suis]|uniref:Uncharacterized protein n=1 Tax=Trichuris suis TaxID=68888 RepID=A0A085N1Q3_9BILA|nr:hypothetical protein M513_08343 [Trichuris suis]KFD63399.1 hypothetical protein M514_08343 [Trichuris suis]
MLNNDEAAESVSNVQAEPDKEKSLVRKIDAWKLLHNARKVYSRLVEWSSRQNFRFAEFFMYVVWSLGLIEPTATINVVRLEMWLGIFFSGVIWLSVIAKQKEDCVASRLDY